LSSADRVERTEEPQVVARGQLVVQREILRHQPDPALRRIGIAGQPPAADQHLAGVWCHETRDDRHGCRLPRAVRS
jgi:hypothetical protein